MENSKEKPNPDEDGVKHLNIYSRGKTSLGKLMTNFSYMPIETTWGVFQSIEGLWFWLRVKPCKERDLLKTLHGFKAKQYGTELAKNKPNLNYNEDKFRVIIKKALRRKVSVYQDFREQIKSCNLPFQHYYAFGPNSKGNYGVVSAGFEWITEEWELIRKELQEGTFIYE